MMCEHSSADRRREDSSRRVRVQHCASVKLACSRRIAMCLGIPGKVIATYRELGVLMGKVDFSGVRKRVCLEHVPEVQPDDYVLVHVGFALSRIDEDEAKRVFDFLEQMNQLDELRVSSP